MKIKTQVSISVIVFVILAVVITSSFFSSTNQLHEIQNIGKLFPDSREVTVGKTLLMSGRITPGSV